MTKENCWEYLKCGRDKDKSCPTINAEDMNGINDGKNGGRVCWILAGTFCKGKAQGTFAMKYNSCLECDFYNKVKEEEAGSFIFKMF